jgi:hypothetical protein
MPILAAVFQAVPEQAVVVFTEIFAELLMKPEDYSRALKLLLREIVRMLRFDFPYEAFARQLHTGAGNAVFKDVRSAPPAKRERLFHLIGETVALTIVLAISPAVSHTKSQMRIFIYFIFPLLFTSLWAPTPERSEITH